MKYDPKQIEKKWQGKWQEDKVYSVDLQDKEKPKYYVLDMLPYPSSTGLHMGHVENYTFTDTVYRFKRMQGFNVLHPQAFDSFGLPAENYAIKTGVHPSITVKEAGANYIEQWNSLGCGYDWDNLYYTSDPEYYKWTQWLFNQFYKNDLVYRKTDTVNWCESCKTVIANEQVVNGACERCKNEIIQKAIPTWSFKITEFADELIEDLDTIDWPEYTKKNQINWVGKSEGSDITFKFKDTELQTNVFTTRADTLFGATFLVLAPENKLVTELSGQITNNDTVEEYVQTTARKTELERLENKEKTGVQLEGVWAVNPASGEEIPVFIADYVLANYGTGAIMAVPAHDERDNEFAQKFGIPIRQVIEENLLDPDFPPKEEFGELIHRTSVSCVLTNENNEVALLYWKAQPWVSLIGGGIDEGESLIDAGLKEILEETGYSDVSHVKTFDRSFNCISSADHKKQNRSANLTVAHYKLNSDTRGVVADEEVAQHEIKWVPINEVKNQITGPETNCAYSIFLENTIFTGYGSVVKSGQFDGMTSEEAKKAITEHVGGTMKSQYRLRDWSISRQRYWGAPIPIVYDPEGNAHAVPDEHLPWELPTDVDFVPTGVAPLAKSQELVDRTEQIFGEGWRPETDTMDTFVCSSWYFLRYADPKNTEVWGSDAAVKHWQPVDLYIGGAEHTYMHLLYARFWVKAMKRIGLVDFDEPFMKLRHQGYVLDSAGVKMSKSLGNVINPDDIVGRFGADAARLYVMFAGRVEDEIQFDENGCVGMYRFIEKVWRQQEKLVNEDVKSMEKTMHKTIAKVTDDLEKLRFNTAISAMMVCVNEMDKADVVNKDDYQALLKLLSPFAPHVTQELFGVLGREDYVVDSAWPSFNAELTVDDEVSLAVQVNGKMRGNIMVPADCEQEVAENIAKEDETIAKWMDGEIKKVIYVPGRILNFIVG